MTSTNTYTHSNHYLTLVCNIALKNKYTRWYFDIISRALERPRNRKDAKALFGYVEGHHILPKSFELEGQKDRNNIAFLTPREHFIVHAILVKMFKDRYRHKMIQAFFSMKANGQYNKNKENRYFNSRLYESLRKYFAERIVGIETRRKISIVHKGKCVSEETRRKLSLVHKGKTKAPRSEETRRKISLSNLGKKPSEETRRKMSEARKFHKNTPQAIQKLKDTVREKWLNASLLTCPHCLMIFKCKTRFEKYHNDNCKSSKF